MRLSVPRPLARGVQVTPSGEVRMEPEKVVAATREGEAATAVRVSLVGAGCRVQLAPSGDVTTVPALPTAMNWLPVQVTPLRSSVAVEVRVVQVMPSGEER